MSTPSLVSVVVWQAVCHDCGAESPLSDTLDGAREFQGMHRCVKQTPVMNGGSR